MDVVLRTAAPVLRALAGFLALCGCAGDAALPSPDSARVATGYDAEIRYTSFAVPHIKANDYGSLGYGLGYAYAEQNVCLLADAVLTVRGERSRFLGPQGTTSVSFQNVRNIDSDVFFRSYFDRERIVAAYRAGAPEAMALARGYAEGVNRYLRERSPSALPTACRDMPWVRPISETDLYLLLAEKAVQVSGGQFLTAIATARSPGQAGDGAAPQQSSAPMLHEPLDFGSNAYAVGRALSATGTGLLLGNPHFPWNTTNRFFQFHLTIPGTLDVMGASISQFPVVNIGFNRDVAWSHTVSTARRFTLYELELAPGDPHSYLFDGRIEKLQPRTVEIDVKRPDGTLERQSRVLYESRFGPILVLPSLGLTWTKTRAFAIHDAERLNTRLIEQWLRINRAGSVGEVKQALEQTLGIPWVNTIAADRSGAVLFADISAAPNLSDEKRVACRKSALAAPAWDKARVAVLDGTRGSCLWGVDASTPEPGLLSARAMPSLIRDDFVLNSNDSFWLANAKKPLTGYPQILGQVGVQQGWRTQMGYRKLAELTKAPSSSISDDDLEAMLFADENYTAAMILDRLHAACAPADPAIDRACAVLMNWDRRNKVTSRGAALYREFWRRAQKIPDLWSVEFEARHPLSTPRVLQVDNGRVREQLRSALREAIAAFDELGIAADASLGELQYRSTKAGNLPLPGGTDMEGVLNLVRFGPLTKNGYANDNIFGSSYIQLVTWKDGRVAARGLLANSQSSDPDSEHYADQTRVFSTGKLVELPFTDNEIAADPNFQVKRLTQ